MKKILFVLIVASLAFGQNFNSPHKIAFEEDKKNNPSIEKIESEETIKPLLRKETSLSRKIFGYLRYADYLNNSQYLRYDLLTHIAFFSFEVSGTTGSISNPSGWPWTSVINSAHANGVKGIMCVANFDKDEIRNIMSNQTIKTAFFQNIKDKIASYNLDGVNIDFEGLYVDDRGALLNGFMYDLTNYIHTELPGKEVSFAGPAINWSGWDLVGLSQSCDYIFIMAYAYYGSSSSSTGPSAPLLGGSYNVTNSLEKSTSGYLNVVNSAPEKLILGLPYYGMRWQTATDQPHSSVTSFIEHPRFYTAEPEAAQHGKLWADDNKSSWYRYQEGGMWHQVWYEDSLSLSMKFDLVNSKNLGGAGMWALGYDGSRTEFWNLIDAKFGATPSEIVIADFNESVEYFDKYPTYSGSTIGIDASSTVNHHSFDGNNESGSLKINFIDNPSISDNWKVRILSGGGSAANNLLLSSNGYVRFYMKTNSAPLNAKVALTIDDGQSGGTELSSATPVVSDGEWHLYQWKLKDGVWSSFAGGNGAIDGPSVTVDAIMFYSDQSANQWEILIDDLVFATEELIPTGFKEENLVKDFSLSQNFPNPFNPTTRIEFFLKNSGKVELSVYNLLGEKVASLKDEFLSAGQHHAIFSSTTAGKFLTSGIYIYELKVNGKRIDSKKMTLLK